MQSQTGTSEEQKHRLCYIEQMWIRFLRNLSLFLIFSALITAENLVLAQTTDTPKKGFPFSPGLSVGDTLYVSGHLGVQPSADHKAAVDIDKEAHAVMASVAKTLADAGMTMDDLVYVEVFCTDLNYYETFNKAYVESFHERLYPARDFIGAKDLLFGAHFEVMGIAVRHAGEKKRQGLVVAY